MSIYQELQQEQGISAAVAEFYDRVTRDPQLAHYFTGVDMPRLRAHQVRLLAQVTGGPVAYEGRDLAAAHARLAVTGEDFDRVVVHLAGTLTDLGVRAETIGQIADVLTAHRDDIVRDPVLQDA